MQMSVRADLSFSVDVPAGTDEPTRCTGRVRADGQQITVEFSPMPSLGGSATRPLVRPLAHRLDDLGLTVSIVGPDGPLIRLGSGVAAPWWQRAATRSSRIRLVSVRALARSVGGPRVFEVALPPAAALPDLTGRRTRLRQRVALAARQVGRRIIRRRR